jgi:hypothetical protein
MADLICAREKDKCIDVLLLAGLVVIVPAAVVVESGVDSKRQRRALQKRQRAELDYELRCQGLNCFISSSLEFMYISNHALVDSPSSITYYLRASLSGDAASHSALRSLGLLW